MSHSLPFIYGENFQDIFLQSLEMFIASSSSPLCNSEAELWALRACGAHWSALSNLPCLLLPSNSSHFTLSPQNARWQYVLSWFMVGILIERFMSGTLTYIGRAREKAKSLLVDWKHMKDHGTYGHVIFLTWNTLHDLTISCHCHRSLKVVVSYEPK